MGQRAFECGLGTREPSQNSGDWPGYGKSECRRVPAGKRQLLALLHAPQPRANFITRATERGIIGKGAGNNLQAGGL